MKLRLRIKIFSEVVRSVESAGLARTVAKLTARFVIKDSTGKQMIRSRVVII